MVGTAYLAPEPGKANFVAVGDKVTAGHYGMGVFEGIHAYETDRGPGDVPAHRPHRAAVQLGARSS